MKKRFLAISLIFALILSCSAFVIWLMPGKAMAEEGDPPAADPTVNFEVMGASIRKIPPMGLRFEVKINADAANAATELGMYLCPTELLKPDGKFTNEQLKDNVMDDDAEHATAGKYIKKVLIGPDKLIVDPDNNEKMLLRLSLVNLVPSSLDKQFSAMAYIKIGENEQTSDTIERSVAYVARRALADPDPELSPAGEDRRFVEAIVENSNDFYITTDGVSVDKTVVREDKFTHRITLGAEGTKDIELSLDKTFEKDVICRIKLFAKAGASGIKINDKPTDTADFAEITLDNIHVVNNKVLLHITGGAKDDALWIDDIRAEGMKSLGTDGIELSVSNQAKNAAEGNVPTITPHPESNTVEYNAHGWNEGDVSFAVGRTIQADEYLVIKFRYYSDMEAKGKYFHPNVYSDEGLWIKGLEGETTHEKHYFSTFDENFLDYTLYMRGEGDTSYVGTNLAVPYGSFHGTKELTTMPGTWYYAVAPVKGNYNKISSCNSYMHIEIADIYSVKEDIKEKLFVPQNYPVYLRVPASHIFSSGDTWNIADEIVALSVNVGANDFECSSTNGDIAAVEGGVITAVSGGTCEIVISLKDGSAEKRVSVEVKGVPLPKKLSGPGIRDLGLSVMRNVELDENGYLYYSEVESGGREIELNENARKYEEYLVFQLLYTSEHWFNTTGANDEGLWLAGYRRDEFYRWEHDFFAVYDDEGVDYTIYYTDDKNPYGSHHNDARGQFGTTDPYEWYYMVAPQTGAYHYITYCEPNSDFYISNVYAITQEARDRYFNYQILPDAVIPAAELNVPETLTVGTNYHANLNASVKFAGKDAARMQYEVLDGSTLVTVDANGLVTAGEATGTCTIRVSAVGLTKDCAVTVKALNPAPKLSGSGVTEIDLGRLITYDESKEQVIERDEFGYLHYSSTDKGAENAAIMIQNNYCLNPDDYVVFVFKYAEGTHLGVPYSSDEGLWVKAYTNVGDKNYMATFDMQGYDYTVYMGQHGDGNILSSGSEVNFQEPYGTLHRPDENALYDTAADTWYCLVTTWTGANKPITGSVMSTYATLLAPFDMTIAGVYTVNETARDRLFKVNVRPGQEMPEPELVAPDSMALVAGDVTVIKAKIKNMDDPPAITYAITDAEGNAADTSAIVLNTETGGIIAKEAGTCYIKVTAGEFSKICAVEVKAFPAPQKLEAGGGGTVTEIGLGIIKDMPVNDAGYITYMAADGDLTLDSENELKPTADEYLVIQFGYIDMAFIDDSSNEGIWFKADGNIATYNTGSHYDYFAVFGEDGKDYTIYRESDGMPYGSFHNLRKPNVATEPYTWYYLVAPNKGLYDSVTLPSFQHSHFNVRIANVYKIDQAYRDAHFIKGQTRFGDKISLSGDGVHEIALNRLVPAYFTGDTKLEMGADNCMHYSSSTGGEGARFKISDNANLPADEYVVFRMKYAATKLGAPRTSSEGLWIRCWNTEATNSGDLVYFSTFDEYGYDYTVYYAQFQANDITLGEGFERPYGTLHRGAEGGYDTYTDTWYYFVAPFAKANTEVAPYNNVYTNLEGAPFDMTISNVYTITATAKERIFKINVRP